MLRFLLTALLLLPPAARTEDHIVPPTELYEQMVTAAESRQANVVKIDRFFSSEPVKKALKSAKIDAGKIQKAVAALSDAELARLAARADRVQRDFAAGALSNQELTYIIIALATAVIILVIVAA